MTDELRAAEERMRSPIGGYESDTAILATAYISIIGVVRDVHAQHADDLCWMPADVNRIFEAAGLPAQDLHVGDKAAMRKNCDRYVEVLCDGGKWRSYAELETALHSAKAHPDYLYIVMPSDERLQGLEDDGWERCPEAETSGSSDEVWRQFNGATGGAVGGAT